MSYLVLARRYRPQDFGEVVGQEHISQTLQNSISTARIAHAYLFSGPRGIGKTTMARILAKALNCKQGPTPHPCNKCISCQEITEGRSLDVLEIDGASHRGIDEIRDLRENVRFAPASNRYKIYIIDEVHMLTNEAFNALLKTLEEPPSYIVFIMATTEPHKVPSTILSRCQRFGFRLIPFSKIQSHLNYIVKKEGITIEQEALNLIAQAGAGSLRDALSVFEQVISLSEGEIKQKEVIYLLGILPQEILFKFSDLIAENKTKQLLALLNEVINAGYDVHQLSGDIRRYFRNVLIAKISEGDGSLLEEISDKDREIFNKKKEMFSVERLLYVIELLSNCQGQMKWSDHPGLVLETTLVKLTRAYVDINEIISKISALEDKIGETEACQEEDKEKIIPGKTNEEVKKEPDFDNKTVENSRGNTSFLNDIWEKILEEINRQKQSVGTFLRKARIKEGDGNSLLLEFSKENMFYLKGVEKNSQMILKAIEKIAGKKYRLKCILNEGISTNAFLSEKQEEIIEVDPQVQKVLDIFKGKIINRVN